MELPSSSLIILSLLLLIIVLTAAIITESVRIKKMKALNSPSSASLPGPSPYYLFLTGIYNMFEMIKDPYGFWETQRKFNPKGISWNTIFSQFIVMITDTEASRKVFMNNGLDSFTMFLHPNAVRLLGRGNIAFMHGPDHRQLRKSFLTLFGRRALSIYLSLQEQEIRQFFDHMVQISKNTNQPFEIRDHLRNLNLRTSQKVFLGPNLLEEERELFSLQYLQVTDGFMCLPFSFPGTTLWKAIRARKQVQAMLQVCAQRAKKRMAEDSSNPICLLDFWTIRILEEIKICKLNNQPPPHYTSNFGISEVVLDFLFASQDASTASLTWVTALMNAHPNVLEKVRQEQNQIRPNDDSLTFENLESMTYTRAVIMEILRYRPPAVFVPHMAHVDYPLTDDFTVKKGTLIFPSVWSACYDGYTNPDTFDPQRMLDPKGEAQNIKSNFLTFGVGPHVCVGREYAINHLMAYLSILAKAYPYQRQITSKSGQISYLPTIYPSDCLVKF